MKPSVVLSLVLDYAWDSQFTHPKTRKWYNQRTKVIPLCIAVLYGLHGVELAQESLLHGPPPPRLEGCKSLSLSLFNFTRFFSATVTGSRSVPPLKRGDGDGDGTSKHQPLKV